MFQVADNYTGPIKDVVLAEPKFSDDADAFDICIKVEGPAHNGVVQTDWWRGEMSRRYGKGNMANKTQMEITMENLRKIGFTGDDLTTLKEQLVGKVIPFKVEAREYQGKVYYDVKYIGGGDFEPKQLDAGTLAERMKALKAGSPSATPANAASSSSSTAGTSEQADDLPWL
jgi:hypothetical protein